MGDLNSIHVACAADAGYVKPLAAMLHSVLANVDARNTVQIHVLDGGIPDTDKALIDELCRDGGGAVHWVPVQDSRFPGVPLWGRMSVSTYLKLLLSDRLPAELTKVIWLDCDLIVESDIGRLWNEDLAGYHALATRDEVVPRVSSLSGVAGWRELGLSAESAYFNAGVMVIDLTRWRDDHVTERSLEYLRRYRNLVTFWDQEGLNAVLAGRWREIDPRWNHNVSVPDTVRGSAGFAFRDAWIVHFAGNLKPWRYLVRSAPHDLYYRHLDRTPWKGWRPPWSPMAALIVVYERLGFRSVLYPLEKWLMRGVRAVTRRTAGTDA